MNQMIDIIKKAKKRIDYVFTNFVIDDPILLHAFCLIDIIPDKKQDTIGISTKSKPPSLKYNPNFINSISLEQLEFVLVQEGFKLLLRHPTTRFSNPSNISSLASNITVNQLSYGSYNELEQLKEILPTHDKFNLQEKGYYEEYFRNLMHDYEDTKEKIKNLWDSMSEQDKQDMLESAIHQELNNQSKEGESQVNDYKNFNNSYDAMKNHFNPNGTNTIEWGEDELFDANIKNMVNEKIGSSKNWGKYTGNNMSEIIASNTPKISTKEILKRFNRSVQSSQVYPSRMKINRRYGLLVPGYRKEYKTKILFAIDVSGSMSEDDISNGLVLVNCSCKNSELTFMTFDWGITCIEKKLNKAKKTFKIAGRGGTNFQPVIDYANNNKFDGVIIYTDGYASEPSKLKKGKLLWLLATKEQQPPCSWGQVTHLNRYDNY